MDRPWTLLGLGDHVTIKDLLIWGCPYVCDSGTGHGEEEDFERALVDMPNGCDVLLTHNPPLGIRDNPSYARHWGSLALRYACWKKEPKLCVFGHVHEARGWHRGGATYYVNATMGAGCDGTGQPTPAVHQ